MLGILLALPYFFDAVVNWDEATFVIAGRSLLDGHLPYTALWDCKPPLVFFVTSALLALWNSVMSVRLGVLILTICSSLVSFAIAKHLQLKRYQCVVAASLVTFFSIAYPGQASLTSEHVALLPLSCALWCLLARGWDKAFQVGLFLSLAATARSNLAYLAVGVGVFLLVTAAKARFARPWLTRCVSFAAGGLLPIIFFVVLYAVTGHLSELYRGVVGAALAHVGDQALWAPNMLRVARSFIDICFYLDSAFLPVTFLLGAGYCVWQARVGKHILPQRVHTILTVFFVAIFYSVIKTREVREHHILQFLPVIVIYIVIAIEWLRASRPGLALLACVCLGGLLIPLRLPGTQYLKVISRFKATGSLIDDESRLVCEALKEAGARGKPVYFVNQHICQFMVETVPVTPVIHPSNMVRVGILEEVYDRPMSSFDELDRIFANDPAFVVRPKYIPWLRQHADVLGYLEQKIATRYAITAEIGDTYLYKKRL